MKPSSTRLSRRCFLAMAGTAAAALPARAWWPVRNASSDTLRLAYFTDVHACTEWETPRALAMAAAAINRERPELVIAGGDLISEGFHSSPESIEPRWRAYLEMHRAVSARVEPVIGNHDLVAVRPADETPASKDPRARFREVIGIERTYRSFDAAGYRFLLLDSIDIVGGEDEYRGRIDPVQLSWLADQLATIDEHTPIILVSHIPLLTVMYQATEGATASAHSSRVVENNREVLELFAGHNLLLVLQGHLHVDEIIRWRGTTFITGGAVCGKWWGGHRHGTPEGFGMLTLRSDRVEWDYQTYGWQSLRP